LAVAVASSFWMMDSTSSMHMRTFSGLRSVSIGKGGARKRAGVRTGVNDATTAVHVVQAEEDLLGDLANELLWDTFTLVTLDEAEEVLS